ncbi:MAG TPA: site-specific DNA-methyltransferase [Caulobacteraceae bacterium]
MDPQIIWNGARIRLTAAQVAQLAETGEVEIGDAQLVWRGKDTQDWSDLVVSTPPLYIQEKIHPKAIIDDLKRRGGKADAGDTPDLFADFNGIDLEAKTEFYQHDQHWSNRMILGDSLQVMASLAEREKLAGKVQCIYFDPPYGIKFNSNWQVSTQSRDVKDGKQADLSREPEQVKAFRDTWKDGVHSYLTYLRDRLTAMRELLTDSGSIFVQIGDENVHRVRTVMDEVFRAENFFRTVTIRKTAGDTTSGLKPQADYILWYAKDYSVLKERNLFNPKEVGIGAGSQYDRLINTTSRTVRRLSASEIENIATLADDEIPYRTADLRRQGFSRTATIDFEYQGKNRHPGASRQWKTPLSGIDRLNRADRLELVGNTLEYRRLHQDWPVTELTNIWMDAGGSGFGDPKIYVVQTISRVVERCILLSTDPGDLVLDPTCGSGTTAYVAEQWGRRWITIDTSRVALALARTRLMSARYPYYLLSDSPEGRRKEQEVSGLAQPLSQAAGDLRQGFVYERAPHVTLKSIANNAEIDVIWEEWQTRLEPLRASLNTALGKAWEEWEIPREVGADWPANAPAAHNAWWEGRIARQQEIDASIARRADVELLYDRPYVDSSRVRVAGPFTVESLSPHRIVPADEDELLGEAPMARPAADESAAAQDFSAVVLDNLRTAGVQQSTKAEKIVFTALSPWPGQFVGGEGRYIEGDHERRAAIFIGPEFGTASRADIVEAAREAVDARFDVLICVAFNFEAHASEITQLGALRIVRAKISPDLHMAGELKNTGKGNLFIVFGEPDIDIETLPGDQLQVRINGVDVFDPNTGDIRSGDTKSIAAWFIDTDYDQESFFVRHAYFLGANDPYKALKTALRAEIDEAAWETLYRDTSRPFARPGHGRIAVKVINHFGDEVMKVFRV